MLNAHLKSVPKQLVRSDQAGDWTYGKDGQLIATVVEQRFSPESELAVAIHELIEGYLCWRSGTTDEQVVKFDNLYEDERSHGHHGEYDEPGDDERAPYKQEHQAATHVERAVCHALGITWEEHCEQVKRET